MNGRIKIFFLLICFFTLATAQDTAKYSVSLKQIEALYHSGQYVAAELEARRLCEDFSSPDSIKVQCNKWIAFSLIAQEKFLLARDRFVALLFIYPEFELDPVLTSPKILSVFYEAKAMHSSQNKKQPETEIKQIQSFQRLTYRTIVFPGWEQLYQNRTTIGGMFLGAGVATLGAGITFEFLRADARKKYLAAVHPSDISTRYAAYDRYRKAEIYSFIAFAVVYVASEIEIFTSFPVNVASLHSPNTVLEITSLKFSIEL